MQVRGHQDSRLPEGRRMRAPQDALHVLQAANEGQNGNQNQVRKIFGAGAGGHELLLNAAGQLIVTVTATLPV